MLCIARANLVNKCKDAEQYVRCVPDDVAARTGCRCPYWYMPGARLVSGPDPKDIPADHDEACSKSLKRSRAQEKVAAGRDIAERSAFLA